MDHKSIGGDYATRCAEVVGQIVAGALSATPADVKDDKWRAGVVALTDALLDTVIAKVAAQRG